MTYRSARRINADFVSRYNVRLVQGEQRESLSMSATSSVLSSSSSCLSSSAVNDDDQQAVWGQRSPSFFCLRSSIMPWH